MSVGVNEPNTSRTFTLFLEIVVSSTIPCAITDAAPSVYSSIAPDVYDAFSSRIKFSTVVLELSVSPVENSPLTFLSANCLPENTSPTISPDAPVTS